MMMSSLQHKRVFTIVDTGYFHVISIHHPTTLAAHGLSIPMIPEVSQSLLSQSQLQVSTAGLHGCFS